MDTKIRSIDKTLKQTGEWLKLVQNRLGLETEELALNYVRSMLVSVRDRLSTEEAVELGSQLPALLRGYYYCGWSLTKQFKKARNMDEFVASFKDNLNRHKISSENPENELVLMLSILYDSIPLGAFEDLKANMPESIRESFDQAKVA